MNCKSEDIRPAALIPEREVEQFKKHFKWIQINEQDVLFIGDGWKVSARPYCPRAVAVNDIQRSFRQCEVVQVEFAPELAEEFTAECESKQRLPDGSVKYCGEGWLVHMGVSSTSRGWIWYNTLKSLLTLDAGG